ncbi:N-acetyl sugar amidotransferase [Kangiella spongicola]|uniref:N-acetyl sugar amidotransferase n=1 Tax=Kangiella spongicola TaxID=796379 RepID=A0A318D569_9GAMM|nr:N-acetyl sugar amidotransferase [Kangiella spongicola]PXF63035.1 N-acetyl sugar amidotransferase [Kangiella spongicola]
MNNANLKQCTYCVMDSSDPDIIFDEDGVCNHCENHRRVLADMPSGQDKKRKLEQLVTTIQKSAKNKEYDCIIGVSGGVDSTYLAYKIKELGLRPLAVHLDNGWNSELAVSNIEKTLDKLDIDLFTYVIDWKEFKDIQLSFLKASVPDAEVPTDHAISAILYRLAAKYNIEYILNGSNFTTEGILPKSWTYGVKDFKYIRGIQKKFGTEKITSFPHYGLIKLAYYRLIKNIKLVRILDLIDYDRDEAMDVLQNNLDWVYYGGKHYESVYTRFFQSYILPKKFGIDKRKAHYSTLINTGNLTREEAINELSKPLYDENIVHDKEFVAKKFDISLEELEDILSLPTKTYADYDNSEQLHSKFLKVTRENSLFKFMRPHS